MAFGPGASGSQGRGRPGAGSSRGGPGGGGNQSAGEKSLSAAFKDPAAEAAKKSGAASQSPGEKALSESFSAGATGETQEDSLLASIAKGLLSGVAGFAGTAIGGPVVGGMLGLAVDEGLAGVDLGALEGTPTDLSRRRSPVPGTEDDPNRTLLGPGGGGAPVRQPEQPAFVGGNTTQGQGGVARSSTQVSGRTGRVPANRGLFTSLANVSSKSLLGV